MGKSIVQAEASKLAQRFGINAAQDLLAALQAIIEEADGPGKPYSGDSYLPPHMIEMDRKAIANATRPGSWANA